ncbi:MAG: hypothetical protein V7703_11035 [Hyphomicrobiales bacterium]
MPALKRYTSPGFNWAKRNVLPSHGAQIAWQFQERLEKSQWRTAEQHHDIQFQHIKHLLQHAADMVPHYAQYLSGFDLQQPLTAERLQALPVLTRSMVQTAGDTLTASSYPEDHGAVSASSSSGSTARPVSILHTSLSTNWHRALTLRSRLWAQNRLDRKLAAIRRYPTHKATYPDGLSGDTWADDLTIPTVSGPFCGLNVATPLDRQIRWLQRQNPSVLLTFPSNLDALCQYMAENGIKLPSIKHVQTLGEALPDDIRNSVRKAFNAKIFDTYSAAEVGEIAIQCPDHDHYHIQSEALYVEVLNDLGDHCQPGETGRVIITALHNYAKPLIRYDIGDLATVGSHCRCGRGLPVLEKIMGRHRNMMVTSSGALFWPSFGLKSASRVTPIRQAQYIQHSANDLEVVCVCERSLTEAEEDLVRDIIFSRLPEKIGIRFSYAEKLERGAGGKFEEFIRKCI